MNVYDIPSLILIYDSTYTNNVLDRIGVHDNFTRNGILQQDSSPASVLREYRCLKFKDNPWQPQETYFFSGCTVFVFTVDLLFGVLELHKMSLSEDSKQIQPPGLPVFISRLCCLIESEETVAST